MVGTPAGAADPSSARFEGALGARGRWARTATQEHRHDFGVSTLYRAHQQLRVFLEQPVVVRRGLVVIGGSEREPGGLAEGDGHRVRDGPGLAIHPSAVPWCAPHLLHMCDSAPRWVGGTPYRGKRFRLPRLGERPFRDATA